MARIPLELDSQSSHYPQEFGSTFGTGAGPQMSRLENLEEIMSKFEDTSKEILDTNLCHIDRELDSNFSKFPG